MMKDTVVPVEFYIPEERDMTIENQQAEIERLKSKLKDARKDFKRILTHDYETLCEFCAHDGECFNICKKNCYEKCHWKGV